MEYKLVDCHPSSAELEKCMNKMSSQGWSYKAPLSNISDKWGWITLIFERRISA